MQRSNKSRRKAATWLCYVCLSHRIEFVDVGVFVFLSCFFQVSRLFSFCILPIAAATALIESIAKQKLTHSTSNLNSLNCFRIRRQFVSFHPFLFRFHQFRINIHIFIVLFYDFSSESQRCRHRTDRNEKKKKSMTISLEWV